MALINCPECGKQISDMAHSCPICGFPIKGYAEEQKKIRAKELEEKFKCKICGFQNEVGNDYCEECGHRITSYKKINNKTTESIDSFKKTPHTICPKCGRKNKIGLYTCGSCNYKYKLGDNYQIIIPDTDVDFNGVYRIDRNGISQRVYCPNCHSDNCSHYKEKNIIPGKTKTTYSANLNPFKPFTLINKKEKIVRKEITYTENKFICNKCGKIFY